MAMFNLNHPDVVSKPRYLVASDVYYEAEPYFTRATSSTNDHLRRAI